MFNIDSIGLYTIWRKSTDLFLSRGLCHFHLGKFVPGCCHLERSCLPGHAPYQMLNRPLHLAFALLLVHPKVVSSQQRRPCEAKSYPPVPVLHCRRTPACLFFFLSPIPLTYWLASRELAAILFFSSSIFLSLFSCFCFPLPFPWN